MEELYENTSVITPDTNFADIGIDSLHVVEMQLVIEERLSIDSVDPYISIHRVRDLMSIM